MALKSQLTVKYDTYIGTRQVKFDKTNLMARQAQTDYKTERRDGWMDITQ